MEHQAPLTEACPICEGFRQQMIQKKSPRRTLAPKLADASFGCPPMKMGPVCFTAPLIFSAPGIVDLFPAMMPCVPPRAPFSTRIAPPAPRSTTGRVYWLLEAVASLPVRMQCSRMTFPWARYPLLGQGGRQTSFLVPRHDKNCVKCALGFIHSLLRRSCSGNGVFTPLLF